VAFEAHRLDIVDSDEIARRHWLVDGGILDNQPFNPVLDRIRVLSAKKPVKRVVMYVVPYATAVGSTERDAPEYATALETYSAAGTLPRDLPKLESLERITREYQEQKLAAAARDRVVNSLDRDSIRKAAEALFASYQRTRLAESQAVFEYWASARFRPGNGVLAQDPADDPNALLRPPKTPSTVTAGDQPWVPGALVWDADDTQWRWGLSPAERVAAWSLLFLRDRATATSEGPTAGALLPARITASNLIEEIRRAKIKLRQTFISLKDEQAGDPTDPIAASVADLIDPIVLATLAYERIGDQLARIQEQFVKIDTALKHNNRSLQDMLALEVARNALSIPDETIAFPFEFLFASARVTNSLGHDAAVPDQKLAGMKLAHFGGFLKRSWRANDWLWGRLDGVEHVMRALVDPIRIREVGAVTVAEELADVALALDLPATAPERRLLADRWKQILIDLSLRPPPEASEPLASFTWTVKQAAEANSDADADADCITAVRRLLAARLQLRVIKDDLGRIAETARDDVADGASRIANGAAWARRYQDAQTLPEKVALFRDLKVGEETVRDETSSRLVFDVGSQTVAVAAAMLAGNRGGVPTAARGGLATVRGLTLASSRLVSLLAREPVVGAAVFAVLVGLSVWAAVSSSTLFGALLPALAILTALAGITLLTIATSIFEDTPRRLAGVLGCLFLIVAPLAFALTTWDPGYSATLHKWFNNHVGWIAVGTAGAAAYAAAALASILAATDWIAAARKSSYPRGWRRTALSVYRAAIIAAFGALAIGFTVEKLHDKSKTGWNKIADHHKGTIMLVALIAALLLASLIETLLARKARADA
jgi:hypothetical protein